MGKFSTVLPSFPSLKLDYVDESTFDGGVSGECNGSNTTFYTSQYAIEGTLRVYAGLALLIDGVGYNSEGSGMSDRLGKKIELVKAPSSSNYVRAIYHSHKSQ